MESKNLMGILMIFLAIATIFSFYMYKDNSKISLEYDYEWTKAICEKNKCIDYQIKCLKGKVLEINPVSKEVIFSKEWVDKRNNQNKLC
ncbi:TPA: hypothetical protein EYQ19_01150 [Candidatus Pacearchaeota archaeon]|jgi:hypothetical protein|nr:hypothetical protein [Candidatus Pacearchaeota archaeon]